jgi:type II secretory pathway component PulM
MWFRVVVGAGITMKHTVVLNYMVAGEVVAMQVQVLGLVALLFLVVLEVLLFRPLLASLAQFRAVVVEVQIQVQHLAQVLMDNALFGGLHNESTYY